MLRSEQAVSMPAFQVRAETEIRQLCLVLDLDDTLFLERDYVRSGFEIVGEWAQWRFGVAQFAERAYGRFLSGSRGTIFDEVLRDCGVCPTPNDIRDMVQVYREHEPRISLLLDSCDFLSFFRGRCRLALISDGCLSSQTRKFDALRLNGIFDPVVFTDSWGRECWKPNPRAFLHIQAAAQTSAGGCVYIADNPAKDFEAPSALGWRTARVRREGAIYSHMESPPGSEPDIEVADLRSLIPSLMNGFLTGRMIR
jgi:putative hydrolase of the HAD superfamily